jgi:hypothetical protein
LYVTDFSNHRILIYSDAATVSNGAPASNVLGQPDFTSRTNNNGGISAGSLFGPAGLFFDQSSKRLWVVDNFNNRVLRYSSGSALYLPLVLR